MAIAFEKVKQYLFEDDRFEQVFLSWANSHAHEIDLDNDENKLRYTELHNEFCKLFEKELEDIITGAGVTIEELHEHAQRVLEKDSNSEDTSCVQLILAMTEFEVFMDMMKEVAAERR